jgi:hypothetical protein
MTEKIQLFTKAGVLVETVSIPIHAEVVSWRGRVYALREGRYVECKFVNADWNANVSYNGPQNIVDMTISGTAGGPWPQPM